MRLQGKVAVVTGASSGIGEATAGALAAAGMSVVAVARREDRLRALAAARPGVEPYPADVTDDAQVLALADHVKGRYGACHVLVNNAGATFGSRFASWEDVGTVTRTMDLNFTGAVRCMAAFADLLEASAPSRVVNVASVAGKLAAGEPAYTASKFALVGFTEAVGLDWVDRGITVSQVNPGLIVTEGFPQDRYKATPLERLIGNPAMVADVIVKVARSGARERTVPRWYRPVTVVRHVAAPLYWAGIRRMR
ncbi:MAG TPA: SDR family NAD(P)-dependent oxidoreductase [Egibacteraceae bacterium]|jgi:NAD(P)-dependent dehydrogenase (short-subunit alcohol dehydrogenase family)|nr:SDR family NAD(P)-dependent oxidoreductase [Egibacteraceae bacterium]